MHRVCLSRVTLCTGAQQVLTNINQHYSQRCKQARHVLRAALRSYIYALLECQQLHLQNVPIQKV